MVSFLQFSPPKRCVYFTSVPYVPGSPSIPFSSNFSPDCCVSCTGYVLLYISSPCYCFPLRPSTLFTKSVFMREFKLYIHVIEQIYLVRLILISRDSFSSIQVTVAIFPLFHLSLFSLGCRLKKPND